jgi:hypothetical protein
MTRLICCIIRQRDRLIQPSVVQLKRFYPPICQIVASSRTTMTDNKDSYLLSSIKQYGKLQELSFTITRLASSFFRCFLLSTDENQ